MCRQGIKASVAVTLLWALAGCTPELPEVVREQSVSEDVKAEAIPLELALERNMVKARPLPGHDARNEEMTILLEPLVTSQPWIRIDPGWKAENEEFSKVAFVTTHTVYVRMPKRKKYKAKVRHVRLFHTRSTGMPENCKLAKMDDERLIGFLKMTGDAGEEPDWKLTQLAVWALADKDMSYAKVQPPEDVEHHPFRGNKQFATAGQIKKVMELLESGGFDREEFPLWRELVAVMDVHVASYENYWDSAPNRALVPFRRICNYYPLEVAADVIFSAFDRHEGDAGRKFRALAVETLGKHRGPREMERLQRSANYESDPKLLESMQAILSGAPIPAAPK